MTVLENLYVGGYRRSRSQRGNSLAEVFATFPPLVQCAKRPAGTLSGGEQQMLAIGRALMSGPALLMLDEPSIGLAPRVVAEIGAVIQRIAAERGCGVLLVEQNAALALEVSHRAYLLELGRIVLTGESKELRKDHRVRDAYLSLDGGGTIGAPTMPGAASPAAAAGKAESQ